MSIPRGGLFRIDAPESSPAPTPLVPRLAVELLELPGEASVIHQGQCPASEVNEGAYPEKPDHLSLELGTGCHGDLVWSDSPTLSWLAAHPMPRGQRVDVVQEGRVAMFHPKELPAVQAWLHHGIAMQHGEGGCCFERAHKTIAG